jgi:lipopolysaccharide biosynthesis glycosyltransferase
MHCIVKYTILFIFALALRPNSYCNPLPSSSIDFASNDETINIGLTVTGYYNLIISHGLLGSLMANPQAHRIHLYLLADADRVLSLECYKPSMMRYFRNVSIFNRLKFDKLTIVNATIKSSLYPGAFDRMFYYQYFPNIDRMLSLDTDMIVLEDLQNLWNHWSGIYAKNASYGIVMERNTSDSDRWYVLPWKSHYLLPSGLNSGLMLQNFIKMREVKFNITKLIDADDERIVLADQDVLNTFGYYHPEEFYQLPCEWNRGYSSLCDWSNSSRGIMHGYNKKIFKFGKEHFLYTIWFKYHTKFEEMTQIFGLFPNGTMIRAENQRNVYYMDYGKKRLMNSVDTLNSLKLDFSQQILVPHLLLHTIPEGELLIDRSGVNFLKSRNATKTHSYIDTYMCQDK